MEQALLRNVKYKYTVISSWKKAILINILCNILNNGSVIRTLPNPFSNYLSDHSARIYSVLVK